jgi:acyl-CoA thioester hydrolase
MSKLEIERPNKFYYSVEIPIRFMDVRNAAVNGANVSHMVFDMYFSLANEAFDLFLKNFGFSKNDIAGVNLIIPNSSAVFQGEISEGDLIRIEVCPTNFEPKACDIFFRFTKQNGTVQVADIRLGVLFFDYGSHKTVPVPEKFKSLFIEK